MVKCPGCGADIDYPYGYREAMMSQDIDTLFTALKDALEHPTEESLRTVSIALSDISHATAFTSGYIAAIHETRDSILDIASRDKEGGNTDGKVPKV